MSDRLFHSLAPLVSKIPHSILAPLIEKLSNLTTENSVDNSVPALALRTVVITLPRPVPGVTPSKGVLEAYSAISRVLIPRLIGRLVFPPPAHMKLPLPPRGMLQIRANKDVDPEAVDVLIEVVRCFGPMLRPEEIAALQEVVAGILEDNRANSVVKKRAVVAVSILAVYLSDGLLSSFVSHLIEGFRNPHLTLVQRRMFITILGSMARSIPQRFGPYLKTLAPFVLSAVSEQELEEQLEAIAEDGEPNQEADDVREAALVALDAFISACGSEMRMYTEEIITAAIRFLKYDPNYNDEESDEEMGGTQSDDELDGFDDDDEFEADGGFDDDDDASWKVRRCAAKVLYTLISTRASGDLLDDGTLYTQVAPILINRFSEREQNVRLEVIATMALLIRKTGEGTNIKFTADEGADYVNQPLSRKRRRESSTVTFDTKSLISLSAGLTSPVIEPLPANGPRADLSRLSPAIIKAVSKQLKGPSVPSKQAVINLLANLISVQHGGLSEYLGQLVDPIIEAIKGSGATTAASMAITAGGASSATVGSLRIVSLKLISDLCETHSSSVLQPYLAKIIPAVVSCVKDRFYKISAEAIGTVEQLVKTLTPPRSRSVGQKYQPDIQKLYEVVIERVSANDADLEVRQRAIHALGILLARTTNGEGSKLVSRNDRSTALNLLKDRLKNETTRLASVRAVDTVAALTNGKDQLDPKWIREVSLELAAQLRKANRSLRGASLSALKNLIVTPAARDSLDTATIKGLVGALLPLLTVADLHLLGPTLLVFAYLVQDDATAVVSSQLISSLCELLTTSLGGAVLDALLILVKNIAESGSGKQLMQGLLQDVSVNGDPAVVGKVIGTLLVYGGPSVGVTLDSFLTELNTQTDEVRKSLALAVLGEASLRLGAKSPLNPDIFTTHFKSTSTKLQLAAAVALGRAGAGNVGVYLPIILSMMDEGGNAQYLLLHSVKEILLEAGSSCTDITSLSKNIWDKLMIASQAEDNKAVGAECIGRLAIIDPKTFLPKLQVIQVLLVVLYFSDITGLLAR
jgi:cullin-associated NEDD8-dissociated protein 1